MLSPRIENSKLLLSPTNQNIKKFYIKKKVLNQTLQTQGLLYFANNNAKIGGFNKKI